ncbi:uncharacterized protein LOC142769082 isoform X2 [Rhipicephalus microplus]|uniref:uncharacterized protein LOC142769082 isoform X2 n=1 Tax=Rhipicephalus microplus TaxID=6941 RepID=UPI003F6C3C4C
MYVYVQLQMFSVGARQRLLGRVQATPPGYGLDIRKQRVGRAKFAQPKRRPFASKLGVLRPENVTVNGNRIPTMLDRNAKRARRGSGPSEVCQRNQYTSCEKTVSKSTEANIVPKIHHVSTQIEHKVSTTPAHQRMCHSQSKVTKQHPLYCRGPRIATPGPVKVVEGASAYAKEAADKTTWCAGIYQTNMYSPTVSCWMQSHNLEDSDNIS